MASCDDTLHQPRAAMVAGYSRAAVHLARGSVERVRFRHHVFLCVNRRPPGGKPSCDGRGSADVLAALQQAVTTHPALCGAVAVTPCGCLGPCFDGPSVVVYPEGTWYAGVTVDDVPELVESHLVQGVPVARLMYTWPED